ncbi:MAG: methyltransferase domain-containing protein [Planctomycetaceae bacterium]|nr:methyltransferase domain-containing protein [Planctomycetaceae bacterium]
MSDLNVINQDVPTTGDPQASSCCGGSSCEDQGQLNVDQAVRDRYADAAQEKEQALCCPVDYDAQYLKIIPEEIIERDYGCGDPSKYVKPGETVLDLGSGGGKICYITSQVVGEAGRVIGVDCNDVMLDLARKYQPEMAQKMGYSNVEFHKGKIQDLKLDLDAFEKHLKENPVTTSAGWMQAQEVADQLRSEQPLIPDNTVDVVVSNCVLNLVGKQDRRQLFSEIFRVLKRGGRAVISDITCDETVPDELQNDPTLWSGCISGAFREDEFLSVFEEAGFYGCTILARQSEPWVVVEGIEFRSLTIEAYKGKEGPCLDRKQAVVYNGPWKAVIDDDGHKLVRGKRMAVCDKTFQIYSQNPYQKDITSIAPFENIELENAAEYNCHAGSIRSARETKQGKTDLNNTASESCCGTDGCC